jgi:hypothetical protein
LLALQGSPTATAVSKLVSPTPARPVPSPAVTPKGPIPEDSKADPTAPAAAEELVEELSDAAKTSYLSPLFLEGTTVMLEETASAVQIGQTEDLETMGRLLAIRLKPRQLSYRPITSWWGNQPKSRPLD